MRSWSAAILLLAAACQQQPKASAKPAEITFDGAHVRNAAALRAHGERLTHVLGCTSCHGAHLGGEQFEPEAKQYGPIWASNLTVEVPEYSDTQLDGIIRHGTHPERKSVWVMPSETFQHLGDSDYRALVAYLRSLKPVGAKTPPPQFSAVDRKDIASGEYKPAAQLVSETAKQVPVDLGCRHALGRYITEVTCAECHGAKLDGDKSGRPGEPPDLIVAGGYTRDEFERLMTKGIPTGNRKIREMMSGVAKYRFAYLTPHERDALYAYLKARAERPQ
ncbi:MAG TPA: c-type cytochrome [Sphingomicrobium sp.]|nr:c-type cytochrome [Sphingomicrobium sp.]